MRTIFGLAVKERSRPFSVEVNENKPVTHLMNLIATQQQYSCPGSDLRLYLAKEEGSDAYLDSKGQLVMQMRNGKPPKELKDHYMKRELVHTTTLVKDAIPASPLEQRGEVPDNVIHLLVKLPNPSLSPSKRPRLEELDDVPHVDLKDKEFVTLPHVLLEKCGLPGDRDLMLYCRPQVHELWGFLRSEVIANSKKGYIVGPPGTGKSACTLCFAMSLDREEWNVVWIHVSTKSVRDTCLSTGLKQSWNIESLTDFELPRADQEKLFIFVDGAAFTTAHDTFLKRIHTFLGEEDRLVVCSSMATLGKRKKDDDDWDHIKHFFMYSWTKEEYIKAVANAEFYESVSSALDATTNFRVNEDDDASDSADDDAVNLKFYYAGGSCRFMFQYNTATVKEKLEEGVESAPNKADLVKFCTGELHSSSINRLYGLLPDGKKRGRFPVSSYAAALFAKKTGVEVIADLATRLNATENPALDGHILEWLFLASVPRWEVELTGDKGVVDKLPKAGVVTFDPDKRFRKTPDQKILVSKLWLQPVKWNQGGYDAVYFDEDTGCVIFIQVTRSDKHDLKLSFFQTVCEKLRMAGLNINQVDIFFVVKPDQFLGFHINHVDDRSVLEEYDSRWDGTEESKVLVRAFRAPSSSVL